MALTNYVGQTVLILGAGYLFDLYGKVGYVQTTLICLAIYVVQIAFSSLWLSVYKMGPLEWIWSTFTYMSFPQCAGKGQQTDRSLRLTGVCSKSWRCSEKIKYFLNA